MVKAIQKVKSSVQIVKTICISPGMFNFDFVEYNFVTRGDVRKKSKLFLFQ